MLNLWIGINGEFSVLPIGRAACELQQMEVLLAEVLFDGSIIELPPADIAALLSCFVCESGSVGVNTNVNHGPCNSRCEPQSSALTSKVALVSRAEVKVVGAPVNLEEIYSLPPSVPDHLQPFVRNMLAKADQVGPLLLHQFTYRLFVVNYQSLGEEVV